MGIWRIVPGTPAEREVIWEEWRKHHCVTIGWNRTGDLRKCKNKNELRKALNRLSPSGRGQVKTFLSKIRKGDIIVVYGKSSIYGYGKVTGKYYFDKKLSYSHAMKIEWKIIFSEPITVYNLPDKIIRRLGLPRTISKVDTNEWKVIKKYLNEYNKKIDIAKKGFEIDLKVTLKYTEKDIEEILANYPRLIQRGLKLEERQKRTKGNIPDLVFKDKKGYTIIIEVKQGWASKGAINQLAEYMDMYHPKNKVKGRLICEEADNKVINTLKRYRKIGYKMDILKFKFLVHLEKY